MTMVEFIETHRLSFSCARIDKRPGAGNEAWEATARHWRCILKRDGRRMVVYFSQGSGHTEAPTLADVLDCLGSDFAGVMDGQTFEAWADELGYDVDSRKAEKTYQAVTRQLARFRSAFGEAAERALAYDVEKL